MQDSLEQLETTYFTLQSQIDMLSAACQTQEQRDALTTQYVQARKAYWGCVNKAFHDDDPQVVSLTNQLTAENKNLKDALNDLSDIAKVLNVVTQVVTVGASLAGACISA